MFVIRITVPVAFACWLCASLHAFAEDQRPASPEALKFFETAVRPVLAKNCFKCHGEDKQKGGLRLDSITGILAGGDSGPAIVPGNPDESYIIEAVNHGSWEMPPDGKLGEKEIAALTKWVEMGAPWPGGDPSIAARVEKITDEDRKLWSFQPIASPTPPELADAKWCRNPIDKFILKKLSDEGLSPAPEANPVQLIRRLYFDLIGLPPSPDEVDAFLADTSPDAYEKLVDKLLASPHYGERWARHWLDVVRYAESDGFRQDAYREHAWRYRDYVIQSLNDDKPYDRFVLEQLAGDEIAPDSPEAVVATGFLRLGLYEYNQRDVRTQWSDILNDVTDVTGDVFLGLGMGCARCHDHKFDPILQKDYYRLQAFFAPMLPRDDIPAATRAEREEYRRRMTEWEATTAEIRSQMAEIERPYAEKAAKGAVDKFPPDIQEMMRKPAAERAPFEEQLNALAYRQVTYELERLQIKGADKQKLEALSQKLSEHLKSKPQALPAAMTVTDVGPHAPLTIIPDDRNAEPLEPGFLTLLTGGEPAVIPPVPSAPNSTGRRTALARWIVDPKNPLTARVMVNRLWQYHFGRGLVKTASDYGTLGEPPSHPELLDWLATQFVEGGWSMKNMHRLMVISATYRQAAVRVSPELALKKDPENRWLWRMNTRRLDAEQIRDAALAATGELQTELLGPSVPASRPRRSIYTRLLRNTPDPMLEVFDVPDGFASTPERNVTTTPSQSLLMFNGDWALDRAKALAKQLQAQHSDADASDVASLVAAAYRLTYGRSPTTAETAAATSFIEQQEERIRQPNEAIAHTPLVQPMPQRDGQSAIIDPNSRQKRLRVPNSEMLPSGDFTIEAYVLLESLFEDATVRTIAAQWDGVNQHAGWSFGVTSEKSKYKPRNLILQMVADTGQGGMQYEVIASGLHLQLNKPYYVAASVRMAEQGAGNVAFYAKDLSDNDAPIVTASVDHKLTGQYRSAKDFMLGGRDDERPSGWHGLLDDVRLTAAALGPDQLLINDSQVDERAVGFWRFEGQEFVKDWSAAGNHIEVAAQNASMDVGARTAALIDFCHALLNSSEFLYID